MKNAHLVLCNNMLCIHINFIIDIKMISLLKPYQIIQGEIACFAKAARNTPLGCEIRNISITFTKEKYAHFHNRYDLFYWVDTKMQ